MTQGNSHREYLQWKEKWREAIPISKFESRYRRLLRSPQKPALSARNDAGSPSLQYPRLKEKWREAIPRS